MSFKGVKQHRKPLALSTENSRLNRKSPAQQKNASQLQITNPANSKTNILNLEFRQRSKKFALNTKNDLSQRNCRLWH